MRERIARNLRHWELWATLMNCEQVSISDVPKEMHEVATVFDLSTPKLPAFWVDRSSQDFEYLSKLAPPSFMKFLAQVHQEAPSLFGESVTDTSRTLLTRMLIVHSAWTRLAKMDKATKWSEADFVANVYVCQLFCRHSKGGHRVQCTISLPTPLSTRNITPESARVLGAKSASPDSLVMLPAASIQSLSLSATSPYHILKRHLKAKQTESEGGSFRFQITPCAVAPNEAPAFQFISSSWEDKKPVHHMLADAYQQNRMATTASVRHLHSLNIVAPVFGLVWAKGTVRAHVDWCGTPDGKKKPPVVYSAPYRIKGASESPDDIFHEWHLDRASDIVKVFFLIENIDHYTMNGFQQRVVRGLNQLVDNVVKKDIPYVPWKRVGDLPVPPSIPTRPLKENNGLSAGTSSSLSTPPPKARGKPQRRSK
ncbi:hypothetical protein FB45DRAFT_746831 [Roridomyces roridus]|uniref:Uncharacterized protein n=1 Tax=Roridomyces roridus TaxID=1738132 RepID=A0AAD7BU55_9AGAR|nr:hypothetical protein FB45DRAFT_746831 [Roridomyces roridus]